MTNQHPPPPPRLGDRGLQCTFIPWQRPHFLLQFLISHSDWQASSEYPSQLSWSLAAQGPDQKFDTGVRPLSQNNSFPPTLTSHGPHSPYLSQHRDLIRSLTEDSDHSPKITPSPPPTPTSHGPNSPYLSQHRDLIRRLTQDSDHSNKTNSPHLPQDTLPYLLQHRDLIRSLTLESDHSSKITPFPPPPLSPEKLKQLFLSKDVKPSPKRKMVKLLATTNRWVEWRVDVRHIFPPRWPFFTRG